MWPLDQQVEEIIMLAILNEEEMLVRNLQSNFVCFGGTPVKVQIHDG